MEKIRRRNFKLFWIPLLCSIPAGIVAGILALLGSVCFPFLLPAAVIAVAPLLFSMVYEIYFYYQLSLDVNAVCQGDGLETKSYLFVVALNAITLGLYGKYWIYKTAQRLQANAPRYGFKMIIGGKEMLVLDILSVGLISKWEFVRNMNRIARVYNQTGLSEVVGGVQ